MTSFSSREPTVPEDSTDGRIRRLAAHDGGHGGFVDTIGGYRIIRKLGSGSRAEVFLGHAADPPQAAVQQAAIKVYRGEAHARGVSAEIGVLDAVQHPHIVRLLDLAAGPDGRPSLILARLEPHGLPRLLTELHDLSIGEALTILAPVADAVDALHRSGYCHGSVGAHNVLFDERGAPVLIGFGASSVVQASDQGNPDQTVLRTRGIPPVLRESDARVQRDLRELAVLAESVLSRVSATPQLAAFREWVQEQGDGYRADFAEELVNRLFDLGEPVAIRRGDGAAASRGVYVDRKWMSRAAPGVSAHWVPGEATIAPTPEVAAVSAEPRLGAWRHSALMRWWNKTGVGSLRDELRSRAHIVRTALAGVRRGVWVTGAVGVLAIAGACAVLIADTARSTADDHGEVIAEWEGTGEREGVGPPDAGPAPDTASTPTVQAGADSRIIGDDPTLALPVLLDQRARCMRELSVLCLQSVYQAGSPALETDVAYLRALREGAPSAQVPELLDGDVVNRQYTLIDRFGDSALVTVSPEPDDSGSAAHTAAASALVIRTEAGWRIRSVGSAP